MGVAKKKLPKVSSCFVQSLPRAPALSSPLSLSLCAPKRAAAEWVLKRCCDVLFGSCEGGGDESERPPLSSFFFQALTCLVAASGNLWLWRPLDRASRARPLSTPSRRPPPSPPRIIHPRYLGYDRELSCARRDIHTHDQEKGSPTPTKTTPFLLSKNIQEGKEEEQQQHRKRCRPRCAEQRPAQQQQHQARQREE